jgi:DNA-binding MarR family transcriptional regulator
MYDQFLAPSGLQITQFTLLVSCAVAGPVPITNLAEVLVMDRTTLARNLKPLEKRGMVKISEGEDRRVRLVELTEKGWVLMKALPCGERTNAD